MARARRPGGTPKPPRRTASSRAGGSASARPSATLPATRPATAARGRRPAEELRTPRSIKGLAILAFIFVMLAVTLIPAMRSTWNQQTQINELNDQLVRKGERVAALQLEERQWSDPAYVEQQARERLKFVRVGEKSYTVIDAEASPEGGGPSIAAPAQAGTGNGTWYGRLWESVLIADNPPDAPALAPESAPTIAPAVAPR